MSESNTTPSTITAEVPKKLIEIFGTRELAIQAANLALFYGEFMQDAAADFYWYKSVDDKRAVFSEFVSEYVPLHLTPKD